MEWKQYIEKLLDTPSSFDGLSLSLEELSNPICVPPIIKASVLMLDQMQKHQGNRNIFVFPEKIQSIFIFTLVKLLYNISEGKIERGYDPRKFAYGDKLRFGKAVVEFMRIETFKGKTHVRIRLADLEFSAPIEIFPLLQKTNSKQLSKYAIFAKAQADAKLPDSVDPEDKQYLKLLKDYRTHMDSSIVYMTSVINAKKLINDSFLFEHELKDLLLVGQVDFEGNVRNIGAGQLGGTPAIVLASDMYAIAELATKGHPIQSIIIDGSNANALLSQLDALDELIRIGVPITCVTDTVNSFDLQAFLDRDFNLWRWDESSITDHLYDSTPISSDRKAKHCALQEIEYSLAEGNEISTAIRKLFAHRNEAQGLSAYMMRVFDTLYSLALTALREVVPFNDEELSQAQKKLDESNAILTREKNYITPQTFDDYSEIIKCLKKVYSSSFKIPKCDELAKFLINGDFQSICIVVPERADTERVQDYWRLWCRRERVRTQVYVLHPSDYYSVPVAKYDATVVVGWLKRAIMRKILYSYNTAQYAILLYDREKGWKNYALALWSRALDPTTNRKIIETSLADESISINPFTRKEEVVEDVPNTDEYEEIELTLRENKYRQYVAGSGVKSSGDVTDAIPVNFIGGYLAFYRIGHKIISATDIIVNDGEKIATIYPEQLRLGDFVVVRESDHDLIRVIADIILRNSAKEGYRELATKWREALEIETLFYTPEEIYHRLVMAGCTRGYESVYRWITDEDMIAPQSKEDLSHIATVTGNGVIRELLDQIYDAAQTVKKAHGQAGKILSQKLRDRLVEALREYGDIDPFNIWDPIEMQVEDVGLVRVLKVIDIGNAVVVDKTDTNRLIGEM